MRFIYLISFSYPSSYANHLQVLKMSEAFSRLCDFTLVVGGIKGDIKDIFYQNSIRHEFRVRSLGISTGRLRMVRVVWMLWGLLRVSSPDTVFYMREPLPAFILSLLSKRFRNNFFFEAHSFVRYPRLIYRRVFRCARGIIATSEKKAVAFQKIFHVPEQKVLIRGNGFDGDFFSVMPKKEEARQMVGLPKDKRVVTMIGKPTDERGIAIFLAAAKQLPDILFISVGGLPQEIERVRSYAGFQHVRFVERVRPEEVVSYYAASDVIAVLLSTAFPEIAEFASPLKAREALATGIPVIFSDVPALHDVADTSLVTFVKANDAHALAESIQSMLVDYDTHQKKADKTRELFMKQNWQNRAEDIVKFMEADAES